MAPLAQGQHAAVTCLSLAADGTRRGLVVTLDDGSETGLADPKSSFLRGAVAVRLHDIKGHPIGYCARRLDPHAISRWGKWRFPTGLPKAQLLYNAHRALAARHRGIVVVECPWAAMRLTRQEYPAWLPFWAPP